MSRKSQLVSLLEDDPNNAFLYFALAKEHEKENDLTSALNMYKILNARFPDYFGLYYHLGKLYEEIDQRDKALETYEIGIKICQRLNENHALSELMNARTNCELGI